MIHINNIQKKFGKITVLDRTTCHIPPGQSVALWGPNGAGKTTLIRCILGLLDFQGQIHIHQYDVQRHGKTVRRLIGYVPQEMAFYDDYRVWEIVHLMAQLRNATKLACLDRLTLVGLEPHRRKRVRELSGGMKQRLALAIALLNDPPILVLDEPTSNLDSAARHDLLAKLVDLKHAGKTILFISHRPEEVVGLADRVLTLEHGRIVADQPATQFVDHPITPNNPTNINTNNTPTIPNPNTEPSPYPSTPNSTAIPIPVNPKTSPPQTSQTQ